MDFDPERYKNTHPYPVKTTILAELQPTLDAIDAEPLTAADREAKRSAVRAEADRKFVAEREAYRKEDARLHRLLQTDAEEEYGFAQLPEELKNIIHAKAWSDGHSSGFHDVWNQYSELVEIALEARKP